MVKAFFNILFITLVLSNITYSLTEKFSPGEFIIEHLKDEHEWHILSYKDKHFSIPLPVILYSFKREKLFVFLSNKFEHGNKIYKNFKLEKEGKYKGKIIEVDENGNIYEKLPLDLSITKNVLQIFIISALLIIIFNRTSKYYKKESKIKDKLTIAIDYFIIFIRDDIAKQTIGEKYEKFMPYLLTVFFFIFLTNISGLIPIFPFGANVTGNIAVPLVLACFTMATIFIMSTKNYWLHLINTPGVPWWFKLPIPIIPIIEILGFFSKHFVLMVRLFANILAGHIIILGFISMIFIFGTKSTVLGYAISPLSIAFVIFMTFLELLVAFIQAYVFTILSSIYFGMIFEDENNKH